MNRYVIQGLLGDLVYRKRQIIFTSGIAMARKSVHELLLDELHSYRWGYSLERMTEDSIEFRKGGRIFFVPFEARLLEGQRADVWVVYEPNVPLVKFDAAMAVIRRETQRTDPNAEIIRLD